MKRMNYAPPFLEALGMTLKTFDDFQAIYAILLSWSLSKKKKLPWQL